MRTAVLHLPLPYLYCPIASPPIYFIFSFSLSFCFVFSLFLSVSFTFSSLFFSRWQVTRGKSGNFTSAGWQVTRCDLIWHVSSHSGESSCKLLYPVFLYLIFTFSVLLTPICFIFLPLRCLISSSLPSFFSFLSHSLCWRGTCLQCFDAVGWATGRASGL